MTANAASLLVQHYVDNSRQLPWRSPPGAPPPEPYLVWLSEVMLQQTTVATVRPRFEQFLSSWPTIEALAAASDEDILKEWAGLGYYARARNLIACAREVARRGSFPSSAAELSRLPGIGPYTSAAIAAIAFGERSPAVDTNVERVIARFRGLLEPSRSTIGLELLELMPHEHPGDFVQAMMDLGATICRPRNPRCSDCPMRDDCAALKCGDPERFPKRARRKLRPQRHGLAYWVERDGALWLVRRPTKGLLGGMAALPGTNWDEGEEAPRGALGAVRHVFTHFALDLTIVRRNEPEGEGWWHPIAQLHEAGLPTLYRKAVDLVLGCHERIAA